MNKSTRNDILTKYRKEMNISIRQPDPIMIKQVDINDRLPIEINLSSNVLTEASLKAITHDGDDIVNQPEATMDGLSVPAPAKWGDSHKTSLAMQKKE